MNGREDIRKDLETSLAAGRPQEPPAPPTGEAKPEDTFGPIYHNTKADISSLRDFDLDKADPNSVWGPGVYAALSEGRWRPGHLMGGKVLSGYVQGDVIDLSKPLAKADQQRLSRLVGREVETVPLLTLERRYGSVAAGLKAAGYAAAVHEGPGGTGSHIVVFDPANIVDAPGQGSSQGVASGATAVPARAA